MLAPSRQHVEFYPGNIDNLFYPANNREMNSSDGLYTAFLGTRRLVTGPVREMLMQTKRAEQAGSLEPILIFDDATGGQVEFDLEGTEQEVLSRLEDDPAFAAQPLADAVKGRGRPKLGVVSREVSLLPRHWEWLERQPGGISGALRKLIEIQSKATRGLELARDARHAAGKFMWGMAGDLPHFEEASRALYAKDDARLLSLICDWPNDVREHVQALVNKAAQLDELA